MNRKILRNIVSLLLISSLFVFSTKVVRSQTSMNSKVDATVKISICGNDVIEGGEDCEGNNLNNKTCSSIGYGGGNLSCDISCSYDTSSCYPISPTATAMPTPTVSIVNSPTPTQNSQIVTNEKTPLPSAPTEMPFIVIPSPEANVQSEKKETSIVTNFISSLIKPLPKKLKSYDINHNNKIDSQEVTYLVNTWVQAWTQYRAEVTVENKVPKITAICDINENNSCNLDDFSIMLYNINR